jgi:hypothetical protein
MLFIRDSTEMKEHSSQKMNTHQNYRGSNSDNWPRVLRRKIRLFFVRWLHNSTPYVHESEPALRRINLDMQQKLKQSQLYAEGPYNYLSS